MQLTGRGAGVTRELDVGRFRVGPGRRRAATELAFAAVEQPILELVVDTAGVTAVPMRPGAGAARQPADRRCIALVDGSEPARRLAGVRPRARRPDDGHEAALRGRGRRHDPVQSIPADHGRRDDCADRPQRSYGRHARHRPVAQADRRLGRTDPRVRDRRRGGDRRDSAGFDHPRPAASGCGRRHHRVPRRNGENAARRGCHPVRPRRSRDRDRHPSRSSRCLGLDEMAPPSPGRRQHRVAVDRGRAAPVGRFAGRRAMDHAAGHRRSRPVVPERFARPRARDRAARESA